MIESKNGEENDKGRVVVWNTWRERGAELGVEAEGGGVSVHVSRSEVEE